MTGNAVYIYSNEQLQYKFHDDHPFNQQRLSMTNDLLTETGALNKAEMIPARKATVQELMLIHDEDYIQAVINASEGQVKSSYRTAYGIGTDDTPAFPEMHDAASWLVGGTLEAVDQVFEHGYDHALNLGGGLHHGFRGKASGFCIYNDSSIAIEYMKKKYGARVLYVDTDAHHGDGVQWAFYNDPDVCTLSFHESGRFLFPGTGHVNERGHGDGYGYSFNVPYEAFSEDESMLTLYKAALREVTEYFKPDIILTQNGADSHYYDPLTHLCGTINLYHEIPKLAHELAHEYCDGKWIAVGGGGYDIWRVVPRAWSLLWLVMSEQTGMINGFLPENWVNKWRAASPVNLPGYWHDPQGIYPEIPRRNEIEKKNERTLLNALKPIYQKNKKHVF
ncbi:acetoin utilization protein AcuC [Salisediminibacterium halotolerans]|uniref:acetoin utilization protein AcuC n=1 Tax=Salisediminibacterium halotolerans TaxID=517425 RepID=UPI000EB021F2|nr:acetoin utilization protein AcuC [Salisediminibacterium halotolerans]RLJ69385.1 acetoin utilization protein AcuC [Actinophytocola xinjiangensis]RPE83989.1 acetoin utilization protein AcuC [Salisediminibacterium halotolerans]TWG32460.1 acetoin utilization protein AcuC [Salisediminibacterium halotolerans]GEL08063.1 acetoin utilization protein AcuC [Salisediminibacterium halotolerans]